MRNSCPESLNQGGNCSFGPVKPSGNEATVDYGQIIFYYRFKRRSIEKII